MVILAPVSAQLEDIRGLLRHIVEAPPFSLGSRCALSRVTCVISLIYSKVQDPDQSRGFWGALESEMVEVGPLVLLKATSAAVSSLKSMRCRSCCDRGYDARTS